MSKKTKIIIVVVVLIVIAIICYSISSPSKISNNNSGRSTGTVLNTDAKLTSSASDASDAALQSDTAALDAQLQGLNNDSASVNQSVNAAQ